jgi:DNA topoisomerase-3
METAGAEDMPGDLITSRRGLGTPATRAGIIENLISSKLIERKDKTLLPTEKGISLIKILPDSVKSPLLTAEWENHFSRIEKGEMSADDFMIAINKFVSDTVKTYSSADESNKSLFPSNRKSGEIIGKCPRCKNDVAESLKGFFCCNKGCQFALWKDNKFFTLKKKTITKETASALIGEGRVFISGLMSEKTGKTYNATIILDDKGEGYPSFRLEFEKKDGVKQ